MDETLIHCTTDPTPNITYDFTLDLEFEGS
jgi:hypothetical protein